MSAVCPECEAEIALNGVLRGELVACPQCGVELEVTATEPLILELAPIEMDGFGE